MKVRIIILLSILAMISWTPNAFAAETSLANKPCSKIGTKKIEGLVTYICQQNGKTKKWVRQAAPIPTPIPSPILQDSVGLLAVIPIVTLESVSQYRTQIANIFIDTTQNPIGAHLGLYVEAPNYFSDPRGCRSGTQDLPGDLSTFYGTSIASYIKKFRDSSANITSSAGKGFQIPTSPINIRCYFKVAERYKFWVYMITGTKDSPKISLSSTTLIDNPYYTAPTPEPTPSISYPSQPVIVLGAPCSPAGASVVSSDGTRYVCKSSSNDSTLTWSK